MSYNFISNKARSKASSKNKKGCTKPKGVKWFTWKGHVVQHAKGQLNKAYLIFKQMVQEDVLSIDHLNR